MKGREVLRRVRRVWAVLGAFAFVVFVGWCLIAYRASPTARAALRSDSLVSVTALPGSWSFIPAHRDSSGVRLLFLAGAMVDPVAYAPLLHQVASRGYPALLLALPWRGAFGLADGDEFLDSIRATMRAQPGLWVLGGHSRGARIASMVAQHPTPRMVGLILLGSTHPREFSLADTRLAVTKVYGTMDGVAPPEDVLANAGLLPGSTTWVPVEGGNHSQFGYYGFQPGDRRASISRTDQQARILAALLAALDREARRTSPSP